MAATRGGKDVSRLHENELDRRSRNVESSQMSRRAEEGPIATMAPGQIVLRALVEDLGERKDAGAGGLSAVTSRARWRKKLMRQMSAFDELRTGGQMTWRDTESGWIAAPEEIVGALAREGFEECKREMTTSRRDRRPAGGVWQGLDTRTGSVASAIWVNRAVGPEAIVFITVDGEPFKGVGVRSAAR